MLYSFGGRDKQGLLDAAGKIRVRASYDTTGWAGGAMSWARVGNDRVYFDARGNKLFRRSMSLPVEFGPDGIGATMAYDAAKTQYRAAFIEPNGVERVIDAGTVHPPHDGLAVASPTETTEPWRGTGGPYGYVDVRGAWCIEPQFGGAGAFDRGVAPVAVRAGKAAPKWGVIDARGAWRCKPKFARALVAGDGMVTVADAKGRWGLVANDGAIAIEPRFEQPVFVDGGLAAASVTRGSAGVVDVDGRWVLEPVYAAASVGLDGVTPVATRGRTKQPKWGLVTRDGDVIVPPTHASIDRFGELFRFTGAYLRTKPSPWGYLSPAGEIVWSGLR